MDDLNVTTPCAICATHARVTGAPFWASRGLDWPVREVAGRTVHKACASEAEFCVESAANGALVTGPDGIGRWRSNGRAIPAESAARFIAFGLGEGLDYAATKAAAEAETSAALDAYRAADAEEDAETLAEMRAAFGPGAVVVNVITNRETRL